MPKDPVADDLPALHDAGDAAARQADVVERVAVDHDEVGELSGLDRPEFTLHPEDARTLEGG